MLEMTRLAEADSRIVSHTGGLTTAKLSQADRWGFVGKKRAASELHAVLTCLHCCASLRLAVSRICKRRTWNDIHSLASDSLM